MRAAIRSAKRLEGFEKPTVWSIMTPLAIETKSVNLVDIRTNSGPGRARLEAAAVLRGLTYPSSQQQ